MCLLAQCLDTHSSEKMRHRVSFGFNVCFYLHDCVRPAGSRNNMWQMILEHMRANTGCYCCGTQPGMLNVLCEARILNTA
jgi:hypothetical protein